MLMRVVVVFVLLIASSSSSSGAFFEKRRKMRPWLELNPGGGGSSVVFPVHGNVYPIGSYNVSIKIGDPAKVYFVDPDTGSDLTWLQCDAPCIQCTKTPHPLYRPSNELVACGDPVCRALQGAGSPKCENPDQCDYEVEYADGGSSLGVLLRDTFTLNFTHGAIRKPRLALGCGYDQIPGSGSGSGSEGMVDGVLGLGRGESSIVSQLHSQGFISNILGHCFSTRGGGFLFLGDPPLQHQVSWTQMSPLNKQHYSGGVAELRYDGKATGLNNLFTLFDSGSSYTYLNSHAYHTLTSLIKREIPKRVLREAPEDQTLPLCWRGKRPFRTITQVAKYFKPLALDFANVAKTTTFHMPPHAYLIISSKGNVCLGILNGTQVGLQNSNIIGDISMQDKMVIYDNEKQRIGWLTSTCDKLPKTMSLTI